jgi:hypothetical protein
MASNDVSGWLIALIGTLAGVVGASAAVIQVFQGRGERNSTSSGIYPKDAQRRFGLSDLASDVHMPCMLTLWASLMILFSWLALAILGVRSGTVVSCVIVALPGLIAIWSIGWLLYLVVMGDLTTIIASKRAVNDLACGIAMVLDMLIVIAAIKIAI